MLKIFDLFCRIYIAIAIVLAVIIVGIVLLPVIILELLVGEK